MPGGCEFICYNEDCEHFNKDFTIASIWPLGSTDEIVEAYKGDDFTDTSEILKAKLLGHEESCIVFPNYQNIKVLGYRIWK